MNRPRPDEPDDEEVREYASSPCMLHELDRLEPDRARAAQSEPHTMNPSLTLYHNPACTKSRATLALIRERGIEPKVVKYLETPPTRAELESIVKKLGIHAVDLLRKGESAFREHYAGRNLSDSEALDAMVAHPILMERPIAVTAKGAAIGRPPENIQPLLEGLAK